MSLIADADVVQRLVKYGSGQLSGALFPFSAECVDAVVGGPLVGARCGVLVGGVSDFQPFRAVFPPRLPPATRLLEEQCHRARPEERPTFATLLVALAPNVSQWAGCVVYGQEAAPADERLTASPLCSHLKQEWARLLKDAPAGNGRLVRLSAFEKPRAAGGHGDGEDEDDATHI